jgi:hypothetical protein
MLKRRAWHFLPAVNVVGFVNSAQQQLLAHCIVLEIELMMLALTTGLMDAVSYPDFHVFASNQTGNTALLAVGALGMVKVSWVYSRWKSVLGCLLVAALYSVTWVTTWARKDDIGSCSLTCSKSP